MHATDFPKNPDQARQASIVILFGKELHLKTQVLGALCETFLGTPLKDSIGLTRFPGKQVDFKTVRDEIQIVSMFSPTKLVVVEDGDDFVTSFRSQLERFSESPSGQSKLVLDVTKWPGNTKLAKKVKQHGLVIECSELTGGRLISWLTSQSKTEYGKQLSRDAAQLIVELAGTSLALLNQELQKLSSYVGDQEKIGVDDVRKLVGGWKAETTWTMINAVRDGQCDVALSCLQRLLHAGEAPQKILGGINFVFKKIANATERSRQGVTLAAALKDSGVFFRDIESVEKYLRRIRRPRAELILSKLAETDYGLKGGKQIPDHLQLEQLILWLSGKTEI